MDNRYYNSVVKEMQSLLDSQGFKADGDAFINENYAVKVEYNEAKQMYILNMAEINEGEIGEYAVYHPGFLMIPRQSVMPSRLVLTLHLTFAKSQVLRFSMLAVLRLNYPPLQRPAL